MAGTSDVWGLIAAAAAGLFFLGMVQLQRRKTTPGEVHKHPSRFRILEWLWRRPGTAVHELSKELGVPRGTIQHHLFILRRAGVVRGSLVGRQHQYFPPNITEEDRRAITALRRMWSVDLVLRVMVHPGLMQRELRELVPLQRSVLHDHLAHLVREGLLEAEKVGRTMRYHATPKLERVWRAYGPSLLLDPPDARTRR